jgi:hypothetical protein
VLQEIQSNSSAAQQAFEDCWQIRKRLYDAAPLNAKWKLLLMLAHARTGRVAEAKVLIDAIAKDAKSDPESLVDAARASAQCALRAKDQEERDTARNQALALLQLARNRGYQDHFFLQNEPDLLPLNEAVSLSVFRR